MIPMREKDDCNGQLLPPAWELAYEVESNRYFYVDHNNKTTTWLNPMDRSTKPKSPADCYSDQLPYGWEKLSDPIIGTYYVDHINRRNQWANPVTEWQVKMNIETQKSLLDIMDHRFGRESSQSVEV